MTMAAICMSRGKLDDKYKGTCMGLSASSHAVHLLPTHHPLMHVHMYMYPRSTHTHTHTHTALFQLISRGSSSIDMGQVTVFLEHALMLGQGVTDTQFCSLHTVDVCARECFRKVGVASHLVGYGLAKISYI